MVNDIDDRRLVMKDIYIHICRWIRYVERLRDV